MSLINTSALTTITDRTGRIVALQVSGVDIAALNAYMLQSTLAADFVPGDITQFSKWIGYAQGIIQPVGMAALTAAGTPATSAFGGFGVGGGSFGTGTGLLSRMTLFQSEIYAWMDGIRKEIREFATIDGLTSVVDLASYASYYNGISQTLTGATNATPIVAASVAHGFTTGQQIVISGVLGNTAANGAWVVTVVDADHFSLNGSVGNGAYTSGGAAMAPYTILYSPDFCQAYWYAYSGGKQLEPSSVFAPAGIALCHYAITGTGAGTLSNNAATNWPSSNGYVTPAPVKTGGTGTTDAGAWNSATAYTLGPPIPVVSYGGQYYVAVAASTNVTPGTDATKWVINTFGNSLYLGGMPMAQAFAPCKVAACQITATINGTCTVTVTAPNQLGVSKTWTAVISAATVGQIIALTPANPGDRMNGVPTAIAIAGTATTGAFDIVTTAERTP